VPIKGLAEKLKVAELLLSKHEALNSTPKTTRETGEREREILIWEV
jgi:hypothetical protein